MGELNKTTSNGAIAVAIDRIANILEFALTKDTPKRLAVKGFIEDVQNSNLSPVEKAVITWNAKKVIREHRNQADIARLSIEKLSDGARADEVDDSWLEVFFDEVRTVSEEDLKALWAHLLSEELEAPGSVPRQVIQILKYMDLPDARAFTSLCNFSVRLICESEGDKVFCPVIDSSRIDDYYAVRGVSREDLTSLRSRGLLKFPEGIAGGSYVNRFGGPCYADYGGERFDFPADYTSVASGAVGFTKAGLALAGAFGHEPVEGFFSNVCIPFWKRAIESDNKFLTLGDLSGAHE